MKWTVKDSYNKAIAPKRLRAFGDLCRPLTLLVVILVSLPVILGVLNYYNKPLSSHWKEAIYIISTFVIINASSNAWNQTTDKEDFINRPYRPIPAGIITVEEAQTFAVVGFIIGIARGFVTSTSFGLAMVVLVLICFLYSQEPIRLKKRLWIANTSLAFARGYIPIVAVWSVFGNLNDPLPHIFGLAMFLYMVGATATKDWRDIIGDKKYCIQTLPIKYGERNAAFLILPFLFAPYVIFYLTPLLRPLVVLIPLSFLIGYKLNAGELKRLEYGASWVLSYLLYVAFCWGFFLVIL